MRNMKTLGVAAIAAAALAASVGASAASAAELYSTGSTVNAGTTIYATLEPLVDGAMLTTTDGLTIVDTCNESEVEGTVNGYFGGDVAITIFSLEWGGCKFTTDTLTDGFLTISASGTVSGNGTVVTVNTGVTCRYGTGGGTTLGTLTTGKLGLNAIINEQAPKQFLCPDTTRWVASYVVHSPHDLTVK